MQDAKCKDKMNVGVHMEDMLMEAYLHPAIRLASVDDDSEYPETIRDGTAPHGAHSRQSEGSGNEHIIHMPSGQSSGKSSETSSIHIRRKMTPTMVLTERRTMYVQIAQGVSRLVAANW